MGTRSPNHLNTMTITHPLYTLSLLYLLSLSVFRVNADGDSKSITLNCGDIKNVTSQNYPDNYNDNLKIQWDVRVNLARRIVITFNDFHTEVGDFLYVKEENYPSAILKYSGSNAATPYLSLGNHLMIIFTSDINESRKGFHLSISCFKETDYTGTHEAFEGLEHTRVMTQPVCKDAWHTDVADTVCREAGFPGSYKTYFTSETENMSESKGINYQCKKSTSRLQDCNTSTSRCIAQDSLVIVCNVLSELGCFDLAKYIHLLKRSVMLSRDQCLTYCKSYSATPQYAIHHRGTNCSCISQTALNLTEISQERSRCRTNSENQTGHYATLFNVSFGFCSEPPELENGSWSNTLNEFMYGTTITAKCNDSYELVGGDRKMRCGMATTSTSQEFKWHGTPPSCQKINTITRPADNESLSGSVPSTLASYKNTTNTNGNRGNKTIWITAVVILAIVFIIVIPVCCILWIKLRTKGKDVESLWFLRRYQINVHSDSGGRSRGTRTRSPEDASRFHSPFGIYRLSPVVENQYISTVDTTSNLSEYPTNIDNLIRSEVSRQDFSLSTVSTSFRSAENSTNDIPPITPFQTASSVEETGNTLTNDQTIPTLTIFSSARTLPSAQVSPRSRTLGAYAPSVCPLTLRPLPLRPISTDRTYAELGTQNDRVNPCTPISKGQSYQGPESIEPTDIDVSDAALRLPGQHLQLQVIPSDSPPSGVGNPLSNGSSNAVVPHPYDEPIIRVDVESSSQTFRSLPGPDELSDSVTSKGSPISGGSTINHDYEDADIQMDRPTPKSLTPNSPDPGGADFDRRMRQAQRGSSGSERKYYSIHDPRPQNKSEEVHTSEEQTPPSHDPFNFTLERKGDDTTEMIVNSLYESTEPVY